ncbi:MAG: hypothetical protein ACAI44_22850 [Candidatus Sericytochromatia bacterium]
MPKADNWQSLVPGHLPTRHLSIIFRDFNPVISMAGFSFTGFVQLDHQVPADPPAAVCYLEPAVAEKVIAGINHYGPVFEILLGPAALEFEAYAYEEGLCQETAMQLLAQLMLDMQLTCRWEAYSWYYDNHESSEICSGTEKELRALFTPDQG